MQRCSRQRIGCHGLTLGASKNRGVAQRQQHERTSFIRAVEQFQRIAIVSRRFLEGVGCHGQFGSLPRVSHAALAVAAPGEVERQIGNATGIGWLGARFEQSPQMRMESRSSRRGDLAIETFTHPVVGEGERSWTHRANELSADRHHQPLLDRLRLAGGDLCQ